MQWCGTPNRSGWCDASTQPVVMLNGASLKLEDLRWLKAYAKYIEDSQTRKPTF